MISPFILKRPIITEKSTQATSKDKFVFEVNRHASKNQIKQAIEENFKVSVTHVNTTIMPGKTRRVGRTRRFTKTSSWKKAIVQLKPGDKIDLFEIKEK